jgi:hypothetical protein
VAEKITQNQPYFFSSAIIKISIGKYQISNSQIPLKVNRNFRLAYEFIHRCFTSQGNLGKAKTNHYGSTLIDQ